MSQFVVVVAGAGAAVVWRTCDLFLSLTPIDFANQEAAAVGTPTPTKDAPLRPNPLSLRQKDIRALLFTKLCTALARISIHVLLLRRIVACRVAVVVDLISSPKSRVLRREIERYSSVRVFAACCTSVVLWIALYLTFTSTFSLQKDKKCLEEVVCGRDGPAEPSQ